MSILVKSQGGYRTAIHIRHHTVYADELISDGGTDEAPTPMEIMIGTLGACIAVTTRAYAQRKGWALDDVTVEVEVVRHKREDYPAYSGDAPYVNQVSERIHFAGDLTAEQKSRLMAIARKCPVHQLLESPVFFAETLSQDPLPTE